MDFVPAVPGSHIIINTTHVALPPKPGAPPPPILNPVADHATVGLIGLFILIGCIIWCFGPSNEDEREIRRRLGEDLDNEKAWEKKWIFVNPEKRRHRLVSFSFVVLWPVIGLLWWNVVMVRKTEDKRMKELEEGLARANRGPLAGAESGKCRMPLL
ncbi:uncharacterized protein B0I36DRAFT_361491 [Microdochium trichocladiopsis]|uniref:Transmembrane protein n=1 Tax=Microdochium trichocladiopsis TaxID=1682393 RepID=A0A9P8Y8X4_9PEZI|nr:uncharacterized protein B0I36DRAFT_361491 [Microdochium trichocladiopsis]KAH7032716.1 hypothetical protein B0I36DRAFT_361491 [Microdochium trichocladiopsis]